uniref:Uncharacterized protein n=1 Tax=Octopus bimaculoides TaxID=37653 RepID=A0A0L8HEJ3_OCTBM
MRWVFGVCRVDCMQGWSWVGSYCGSVGVGCLGMEICRKNGMLVGWTVWGTLGGRFMHRCG